MGGYYVMCGCLCLIVGQGELAYSPWLMGITFGLGQLISAFILYWTLERVDDRERADGSQKEIG
ncbi:MAG: hypothetical protein R3C11_03665 [Planctomycetaceae bacterium]